MTEIVLSRRTLLAAGSAAAAWLVLPVRARASALSEAARAALGASPLVYVSPLKSDGSESACHAEVWFAADGDDALVVTASGRWRARAIEKGLDRARLWVGDLGVWARSGGGFRTAPTYVAKASLERDAAAHERALALFGKKYPAEWGEWGPRFRAGLADGSRVLIRYAPAGP
jgi:hypothetical protein